jgi:hypothetical protein
MMAREMLQIAHAIFLNEFIKPLLADSSGRNRDIDRIRRNKLYRFMLKSGRRQPTAQVSARINADTPVITMDGT